ncbi:ATP-binding protein [Fibrella sp. WM1]|uniref:ATP-binding protein n=1 Tax=Fibrella musci TaxID=3242485 RepID=UPI003520A2E7
MKSIWPFLLFCLLSLSAGAQVFRLDSLPAEGVWLDKGWRWQAGDNLNWRAPAFDDSRWDTIPAFPGSDSLPGYRQHRIGWIRIAVEISPRLVAQPIAIQVYQRGAADLYLDGQLIRRFGSIGPGGQLQRAEASYTDEYTISSKLTTGRHVFAVRLAKTDLPGYVPSSVDRTATVLALKLAPTAGLVKQTANRAFLKAANTFWVLGFFLALAVVHLFYFIYRRQRVSLVFVLTMLLGAAYIGLMDGVRFITNPVMWAWLALIRGVALALYLISLLLTYHLLLRFRLNIFFWIGSVLMLGNVLLDGYTSFRHGDTLFSIGISAMFTSGMALSIRAVKARQSDGWVTLGCMIVLIMAMTTQLFVNLLFPAAFAAYAATLNELTSFVFLLTVPLTLALLLARENAKTNQQLAQNLAEVKQLSAEKEDILTQQKALLEQQVAERTQALRQSLDELRTTQQQLVQREKMASLGELTAGIAHEIQNPLNFVNNFTEVSIELAQELGEERTRPERDEALETELLTDLTQNLEKIGHHGKRASNIVRGMLEHSRSSTGERQPTDLNALADEYLRLSYHGLRAKDKSFNAKLVTEFDPTLPRLSVVGQDIGRVLLNLFNNGFYAVQERARQAPAGYEPTISVKTEQLPNWVRIRVSDNGMGIPTALREKIFQPFFTTKPTGQGTGLGLSLSYDIISKGHAGTLRVESDEGVGTTFVIELPTKTSVTGN